MNEKYIERKLVEAARKSGGLAQKLVSPGFDGVPDRIILLPSGRMAFAELKASGKGMRPLQVRKKSSWRLSDLRYIASTARSRSEVSLMRYEAHDYQKYATDFILTHPVAAVFLEMGLGKSVITLTALFDLILDMFLIRKVLVIAPLCVARDTWPSKIKKWDHLKWLTFSVAVGSEAERKAALMQTADIYIINRENVDWLIIKSDIPFDFDMVVIDELSSFKSHQAKRFKSLLKARPKVKNSRSDRNAKQQRAD